MGDAMSEQLSSSRAARALGLREGVTPQTSESSRLKVLSILGTRPEAIKMAPVIRELASHPDRIVCRVCVTGQHRQLLDQVLDLFRVKAHYDLRVMEENQTPTRVASAVLAGLEPILHQEAPHWVLVQGDTTTVLAASLAAFYARVGVGHVEAGLRTQDRGQPFPEEINRRLAAVLADRHFAPTPRARQNLLDEGVPRERILVTGNPVIDALHWVAQLPTPPAVAALLHQLDLSGEADPRSQRLLPAQTSAQAGASAQEGGAIGSPRSAIRHWKVPLPLPRTASSRLLLVTAHRRENHGQPLHDICLALADIAARGDVHIVYPVHPNPNVWNLVHERLDGVPHVTLIPPLDYLSLIQVMKRADLVLTDSGGIQEEAPALGVPVLVLRQETERPEGVEVSAVHLVGTDRKRIVAEACRLLDDPLARSVMSRGISPYGDGRASERIVAALLDQRVEEFAPQRAGSRTGTEAPHRVGIRSPSERGVEEGVTFHSQCSVRSRDGHRRAGVARGGADASGPVPE